MYTPTVGIVCLAGKVNTAQEVLPRWQGFFARKDCDFVFVETGTEKEQADINRRTCIEYNVKRVWVPDAGENTRAQGRNAGSRTVAGEYLWFVDGDCRPDAPFEYVLGSTQPDAVITGGLFFEQQDGTRLLDHRSAYIHNNYTLSYKPWLIAEANVLVSRTLFRAVSGWDASWAVNGYCAEGVEFYWRCLLMDFAPLVIAPNMRLIHMWHEKSPEAAQAIDNLPALLQQMEKTANLLGLTKHPLVAALLEEARQVLFR